MSTNFIFTPEDTKIIIIEELKNNGYKFDVNTDIEILINADFGNNIQIVDTLECRSIRLSHIEFKKIIKAYNEIIKKINNE